ncbi:hypothetical protein ACFQ6N_30740 [Kitasatospora sp. NPDC056446]|uniref:hypothetical protein n=1 Tax=Kitasatospora sp. NPDC056446 TaxID=3345819 RepID=UPI0036A6D8CB
MTSLHPAPTEPPLPGPPRDGAGSSPPPGTPGQPATTVPAVPICSIATATETGTATPGSSDGAGHRNCATRHDSVPRPRGRNDADAPVLPAAAPVASTPTVPSASTADHGDPTADRLRAAFAERLRAARARGRTVAELAEACRRPVAEVRALLGEPAGDEPTGDEPTGDEAAAAAAAAAEPETEAEAGFGFVRFTAPAAAPKGAPPVEARRPAREQPRPLGSRRPSPSRRLRRMHPQAAAGSGQEATARETAAPDPTRSDLRGTVAPAGELGGATGTVAGQVPYGTDAGPGTGTPPAPGVAPPGEPPLGILIGGSPGQPETVGWPEERAPVRVAAEPIRVGRGTSLVVLPSWRPAIAVSVSTEQLLSATGLGFEQLADARLTVLMNPGALHDRELELHGWQPVPASRGRRGGHP